MAPLPPGLFSTTTGTWSFASSALAMTRADVTAGPPARNAPTTVVGVLAAAPVTVSPRASARIDLITTVFFRMDIDNSFVLEPVSATRSTLRIDIKGRNGRARRHD